MTQRINTNLHSNSYFKVPKFSNSTNSKINLNDYEEVEDEYGFRYMRKKQRLLSSCELIYPSNAHEIGDEDNEIMSTPIPSNKMATVFVNGKTAFVSRPRINEAFSPSTPTPSKQILENNRKKRRSSFAVVDSSTSTGATVNPNSTNLRVNLPPENVKTFEYHRHIETDLPGPVKMRQLMIWACKKAARPDGTDRIISEKSVDGLISNEITTTWYQRPNNTVTDSAVYYLPNPQNQELSECIELYKSYHKKLEKECELWEDLKTQTPESLNLISKSSIKLHAEIDNSLNILFAEEFQNMNKWLNSLPLSIDRFDWNTKLALSFQDHAKQFCEGVFHQIFAKFFSSDLPRAGRNQQRIEPMMLLRALSTNQSITN